MILVTGATGFIGSHLVESLLQRGEKVRALVRRRSALAAADVVYGDVVSGAGLEAALTDVEIVIHLAGATKALHPGDYYTVNVKGAETLARMIAGRPIRFVHVSSLAAAGPGCPGIPITEDADPRPITHYGKSKLQSEYAVRALRPDAVIVRPPVVYGPRDTDVLQVLRPISRGWALQIAGAERWFSAIYVRDLADGLLAAARSPVAAGRTYFISHSSPVSWSELTSLAGRIMGRRPRMVRVPGSAALAVGFFADVWARATRKPAILSREKVMEARSLAWVCDSRRAAVELGFEALTGLEKGLSETLAWYKGAGWLRY
jgi:nucleoside-diphosphate-sugar epimerase